MIRVLGTCGPRRHQCAGMVNALYANVFLRRARGTGEIAEGGDLAAWPLHSKMIES